MIFNKIFGIMVLLVVAATAVYYVQSKALVRVCGADVCVNAEIVSTKAGLERGLQGRVGLNKDQGMLFVFAKDDRYRFWMKDMKFTLDILWLDSKGGIVAVGEDLPPCTADPCPVYAPPQDARYVLEVNAGFSRAHGLKPGTRLVINNP